MLRDSTQLACRTEAANIVHVAPGLGKCVYTGMIGQYTVPALALGDVCICGHTHTQAWLDVFVYVGMQYIHRVAAWLGVMCVYRHSTECPRGLYTGLLGPWWAMVGHTQCGASVCVGVCVSVCVCV